MSYLAKGKKQDLIFLAEELGITVDDNLTRINIRDEIIKSDKYDEEFTKELYNSVITERLEKEREERERERDEREIEMMEKERERRFEIEKLKLQTSSGNMLSRDSSSSFTDIPKLELQKLIPSFNEATDDIGLFLNLFEKQLNFLQVPSSKWVVYLIGLLPSDITRLIAQETAEDAHNYEHVKRILLKRFKISAEKFRNLFLQHRRKYDNTWRDCYFHLRSSFDGWLNELQINSFDQLKSLIISDQMKNIAPPDYKERFIDHWSELVDPKELADKFDSYEEIRSLKLRNESEEPKKNAFSKCQEDSGNNKNYSKTKRSDRRTKSEDFPQVSCYGCGKEGVIKPNCPTCTSHAKLDSGTFNSIRLNSFKSKQPYNTLLEISINGRKGTGCVDTGASHTIVSNKLYNILKADGVKFKTTKMSVTLADGFERETEVYKTEVKIQIKDRSIKTELFAFKTPKNNRTLLGIDFLKRAGIVIDVPHQKWFFARRPRKRFRFSEDKAMVLSPNDKADKNVNSTCLREDEGKHRFLPYFRLGEETNPKVKHVLNTGDNPPVSVPPSRIPESAVIIPDDTVASLDVQFGDLQFGNVPSLIDFGGNTNRSRSLLQKLANQESVLLSQSEGKTVGNVSSNGNHRSNQSGNLEGSLITSKADQSALNSFSTSSHDSALPYSYGNQNSVLNSSNFVPSFVSYNSSAALNNWSGEKASQPECQAHQSHGQNASSSYVSVASSYGLQQTVNCGPVTMSGSSYPSQSGYSSHASASYGSSDSSYRNQNPPGLLEIPIYSQHLVLSPLQMTYRPFWEAMYLPLCLPRYLVLYLMPPQLLRFEGVAGPERR